MLGYLLCLFCVPKYAVPDSIDFSAALLDMIA